MRTSTTEVDVRHEPALQRFVADAGGGLAVLEYARVDDRTLDYHHTFVPPAARGRRIASTLAAHALDYALANRLDVIPSCPFVAAYVGRHPQYRKLVKR